MRAAPFGWLTEMCMRVSSAIVPVGLFVVCMGPACSSSSTTGQSPAADASARHDATGNDATESQEAGADDATAEAAATCDGLDAAVQGLTFPGSCEACIGVHCCMQGLACAAATGCKDIEECAAKCVAAGTAAQTCAEQCIAPDGSTSNFTPGQSAAETLDLCLAANCSSVCS